MSWSVYVTDILHPKEEDKRAIVVCYAWKGVPYVALVKDIEPKKVTCLTAETQAAHEALALSSREIELKKKIIIDILERESIQAWPCCKVCGHRLLLSDNALMGEEIFPFCRGCGTKNTWVESWKKYFFD